MVLGPVYDPTTPEWKKLTFLGFVAIAALVLNVARTKPRQSFVIAIILATIAVVFIFVIYVYH
jgi:hypothetical protein